MKFMCMMIARKLYSIFALGALLQVECGDNPEVVAISNPQAASDDESPISVLKIWDGNPEDKAPTRNRPPKKYVTSFQLDFLKLLSKFDFSYIVTYSCSSSIFVENLEAAVSVSLFVTTKRSISQQPNQK